MLRKDIIDLIGQQFYTYTIGSEAGEFFYNDEFKAQGKAWDKIKIKNTYEKNRDAYYTQLDIRFVFPGKKLTICVETKTDFKKSKKAKEMAQAQLDAYMTYEKLYSGNTVVGILASTAYEDVLVYKDSVSDSNNLDYETMPTMNQLINDLFPKITNDKETVMSATYKLNEILHGYGIEAKVRGQFVGTCLLALKNDLDWEQRATADVKVGQGTPRRASTVLKEIESILSDLLKEDDSSLKKGGKIVLLANNVLENEKVQKLSDSNLHEILNHINSKILPFINDETTAGQDILNLFFTTFNKYVDKDDKNQAFTPDHITDFMAKITEVDYNSRVLDPCCGSGAFLVRALVQARNSCTKLQDAVDKINEINRDHIFGIEYSEKPFGLATTNMLIHGDGNTNVIQANCFDKKDWIMNNARPTIILMNPPYNAQQIGFPTKIVDYIDTVEKKGKTTKVEVLKTYCSAAWPKKDGKPAKEDPTKGLCFVEYISDCLHEANITGTKLAVLLPLQCAIGSSGLILRAKENILKRNTLDAVFTLPSEVFYPGASANACCMLFTMGTPHCHTEGPKKGKPRKKTFFGYYKEDGFKKKKNLGRVEQLDKDGTSIWKTHIEPKWIELFENGDVETGLSAKEFVGAEDEWLCEAYMETDYSDVTDETFKPVINSYCAYLVKNGEYPVLMPTTTTPNPLNVKQWKDFAVSELFTIVRGDRIVRDVDYGDIKDLTNCYPVITTTMNNNGVDGYYSQTNCDGNCLISAGEASGMYTTYQENPCWALDTVRIYKPIGFEMTKLRAMFLASLLTKEMYRFSYGRKAKPSNMYSIVLKLPATETGAPDWQFMENYIKSLPYGDRI